MIGIVIIVEAALISALVVIKLMSVFYERDWAKNFELDVAFSEEQAGEGDTLYLYEVMTNNKKRILPAVCVKFRTSRYLVFEDLQGGTVSDYYYRNDVISVRGYEKVRRKLAFRCARRGQYTIDTAELLGNDYFLHRRFVEKKELHAQLIVYPRFVGVEKILPVFEKGYGEMASHVPLFENPFEYAGVREYMPGDSMNRINWKASAKTGRWQIRTSAYTSGEPALIVLNLESPGNFVNQDAMEENIRIAYSLIFYLDKRGMLTELLSNGDMGTGADREGAGVSGTGRDHMADVKRRLAVMDYRSLGKTGAALLQRALETVSYSQHVFFISSSGKPEIQEKLVSFRRKGISVTWVATVFGGEDDTGDLLPGLEQCIYRWKG